MTGTASLWPENRRIYPAWQQEGETDLRLGLDCFPFVGLGVLKVHGYKGHASSNKTCADRSH